ncbi:MAG: hypothetical protein ACD_49C00026G0018 [uncultured bacterium (gcode 4)]|uniref:Uncharacterized protein n=1 Tax=uncultured bacterium (gcode 4) TaxID=1234023 RepID=K2BD42_9BACT|nr:MAG: hypothetical protein ACD_49C00026G0018 [uncultured bacterium (gcode 4)]
MSEIKEKYTEIPQNQEKIENNTENSIIGLINKLNLLDKKNEILNLYNNLDEINKWKFILAIKDNEETISKTIEELLDEYETYKKEDIVDKKEDIVDKKEVVINKNEKEKIEQAKTRLDAFYKNLWVKDKSEFFKQNPELKVIYDSEVAKYKKINPGIDLGEESDGATKLMVRVVLQNRDKVKIPDWANIKEIFWNLESSAISLGIDYNCKLSDAVRPEDKLLARNRQAILNWWFSNLKLTDDVIRKWNELIYEKDWVKQVWNIWEIPPGKYLEQDWIKISSKLKYEPNYENLVRLDGLRNDIALYRKNIAQNQDELNEFYDQFKVQKNNPNLLFNAINNQIEIEWEWLTNEEKEKSVQINSLKSIIKFIKILINEIESKTALIKMKEEEITKLEQKEKSRIPDYKDTMTKNDETIKFNLTYLKSLHLDIFWDKIDKFIYLINQHKSSLGHPWAENINLSQKLSQNDEILISKALIRILWEDWEKLFNKDKTRMLVDENTTSEKIKDRLVKTWALAPNRTEINILNIEWILEKGK